MNLLDKVENAIKMLEESQKDFITIGDEKYDLKSERRSIEDLLYGLSGVAWMVIDERPLLDYVHKIQEQYEEKLKRLNDKILLLDF